jgi:copper oxidase (laccase) domain-containing protein
MQITQNPEPIQAERLQFEGKPFIRHGFFTRKGGVSSGIYEGLNTGTGSNDDAAAVSENRRRIAEWMGVGPEKLLSAWQIHSPDALVVTGPFSGERPKVDALVTDRPGLAIGASHADCGPVLFADPQAGVIGAAHAGWKGALTGVLESTIAAHGNPGRRPRPDCRSARAVDQPGQLRSWPGIHVRFLEADRGNEQWFAPSAKAGHHMFDLNGYTVARLNAAGVDGSQLGLCTYADEEKFFSYRRTTHRGEPDYGRHISAIVMSEE